MEHGVVPLCNFWEVSFKDIVVLSLFIYMHAYIYTHTYTHICIHTHIWEVSFKAIVVLSLHTHAHTGKRKPIPLYWRILQNLSFRAREMVHCLTALVLAGGLVWFSEPIKKLTTVCLQFQDIQLSLSSGLWALVHKCAQTYMQAKTSIHIIINLKKKSFFLPVICINYFLFPFSIISLLFQA